MELKRRHIANGLLQVAATARRTRTSLLNSKHLVWTLQACDNRSILDVPINVVVNSRALFEVFVRDANKYECYLTLNVLVAKQSQRHLRCGIHGPQNVCGHRQSSLQRAFDKPLLSGKRLMIKSYRPRCNVSVKPHRQHTISNLHETGEMLERYPLTKN